MESKVQNETLDLENRIIAYQSDIDSIIIDFKARTFQTRWKIISLAVLNILLVLIYYFGNKMFESNLYTVLFNIRISRIEFSSILVFLIAPSLVSFIYNYIKLNDAQGNCRLNIQHFRNLIEDCVKRINRLTTNFSDESRNPNRKLQKIRITESTVIPTTNSLSTEEPQSTVLYEDRSSGNDMISDKLSITIDDLMIDCRESRVRLISEIDSLKNRGALNLGIGSALTLIGIGILLFSLIGKSYTSVRSNIEKPGDSLSIKADLKSTFSKVLMEEEMIDIIPYYVSRVTTVIFIEVFSFFFLRLYRNSLSDIKYYQNELTNLEAKFLSLKSSLYINQLELKICVIQEILKTERNALINLDQTNLINNTLKSDSERDRNFTDNFRSILDSMTKFVIKDGAAKSIPTPP